MWIRLQIHKAGKNGRQAVIAGGGQPHDTWGRKRERNRYWTMMTYIQ